jgi:hypothetical protein
MLSLPNSIKVFSVVLIIAASGCATQSTTQGPSRKIAAEAVDTKLINLNTPKVEVIGTDIRVSGMTFHRIARQHASGHVHVQAIARSGAILEEWPAVLGEAPDTRARLSSASVYAIKKPFDASQLSKIRVSYAPGKHDPECEEGS